LKSPDFLDDYYKDKEPVAISACISSNSRSNKQNNQFQG